jgi:methylphosphotriester-DNA--protein-cysteine methyltransferase
VTTYTLIGRDGVRYRADAPGTLGGNRASRIYGRLDCPSALRAVAGSERYARSRVFFADEETAIAAGYRPCHSCMRDAYFAWKAAREG